MNRNRVFLSRGCCFIIIVLIFRCFFNPQFCYAQILMTETGSHFQDFNSLSATEGFNNWVDNSTIPGWYWQYLPSGGSASYLSDDGTSDQAVKRCYGTTGEVDRAIGGLCDKDNKPFFYGIKLLNSSSQTIKEISVGYTGEKWRNGPDGSPEKIAFSYMITKDNTLKFTFTSSPPNIWIPVTTLDFISNKVWSGSTNTLNGNDPANRVIINEFSIPGLVIPSGSYILFRWTDLRDTQGDFGLAIDDVTVKWTVPANGPVPSFAWTGVQSTDWSDNRNWSKSTVPVSDSDVEIAYTANEPVSSVDINIKNLVILNGGHLTIGAGKTMTVSENSIFNGKDCLALISPTSLLQNAANDHAAAASFLCNGIVSGSGSMKVERYISQYLYQTDGWHFFSSPVNQPAIDVQFLPDTNDDLFAYSESNNDWLNQKISSNSLNTFVNGQGYLVSYGNNAVHSISGLPNNNDINFTNLSFTGNRGWQLLGNPFPCGISWDTGDWKMTGVSHVAKLLNSGGTYSDVSFGDAIPAMNGFFIKVNASGNAITIPRSARVHNIIDGWKGSKATTIKKIKLVVSSNSNTTFAETKIILNDKATMGYDVDYDSPYLSGMNGTPLFYSVSSTGQELSTNCVPDTSALLFNLGFTPGLAKTYTLKAEIAEEWAASAIFILEDKLTKLKYTLNNSSAIIFSSDTIDAPDRFKLTIDIITGIEKRIPADSLRIMTGDRHFSISVPDNMKVGQALVYDLAGRLICTRKLINGKMDFTVSNTGIYFVHVLFNKGGALRKIFIP